MASVWRWARTAGLAAGLAVGGGCGEGEEPAASATTVTTSRSTTTETPTTTTPEPQSRSGRNGGAAPETSSGPKPLEVSDVLDAVLTGSADPALICDQLATENYVRAAYGAREGCIAAQQPGALARSLDAVYVNRSEGDRTRATVVPVGGPYDGVEVEVELVRDGEGWRVDSLAADVPAGP